MQCSNKNSCDLVCMCMSVCVHVCASTLKFLFVQWTVFQYLSLLWALITPSTVNEASGNEHRGLCQHINPLNFQKCVWVSEWVRAREWARAREWSRSIWISVPLKVKNYHHPHLQQWIPLNVPMCIFSSLQTLQPNSPLEDRKTAAMLAALSGW